MSKKHIKEEKITKNVSDKVDFFSNIKIHSILLVITIFLLYANTLGNSYALDDDIVIKKNAFTTQGFAGIPSILKYDTFYGFFQEKGKSQLVSGGRYRPFTLIMFATEWQFFGDNPFLFHFLNISFYAILSLLLYHLLKHLFSLKNIENSALIAFIITLLFVCHPVHTEVVANIKGRDEIMSLLFGLLAIFISFKSENKTIIKSAMISVIFFCGLMSKENSIMFLGIVPLLYYVFTDSQWSNIGAKMVPFIAAAIVFIIIRTSVIGMSSMAAPLELMNNPFIKIMDGKYFSYDLSEKLATITFTLLKYLGLMLAPLQLTHDYYPMTITLKSWTEPLVLLSLIVHILLIYASYILIKRKNIIGIGIAMYLITLFIVSNILFPVGTFMGERFLFMPSLGFIIAFVFLISKYCNIRILLTVFVAISALFSFKTVERNKAWKDNFTLFGTDVLTSTESIKLQHAYGAETIEQANKPENAAKRIQMLNDAIPHLQKAIAMHPNDRDANLSLGNALTYLEKFDEGITVYKNCLLLDPDFKDGKGNMQIAYRLAGQFYGEKQNNIAKSIEYLNKAYELNPNDIETLRLLGISNGIAGNQAQAVQYFEKGIAIEPNNAFILYNLGVAYMQGGKTNEGQVLINKAYSIDPSLRK
jgi:protein O-mannosyl-transferase